MDAEKGLELEIHEDTRLREGAPVSPLCEHHGATMKFQTVPHLGCNWGWESFLIRLKKILQYHPTAETIA